MIFKEDGRLTPATKEEVASVKGKLFVCPHCDNTLVIDSTQFASKQICNVCGYSMLDSSVEVSKLTGRLD